MLFLAQMAWRATPSMSAASFGLRPACPPIRASLGSARLTARCRATHPIPPKPPLPPKLPRTSCKPPRSSAALLPRPTLSTLSTLTNPKTAALNRGTFTAHHKSGRRSPRPAGCAADEPQRGEIGGKPRRPKVERTSGNAAKWYDPSEASRRRRSLEVCASRRANCRETAIRRTK